MIPLSVPVLKGNEKKYLDDAITSGWVSTAGSYVTRFEREMADYLKVPNTAAVQSGTAALHLAMLLSGIKRDEEVIVPTLTFIAAVNPVTYLGAHPIFMDCDHTLNMDLEKLEMFLKTECTKTQEGLLNRSTGRIIKAVVIVHVFGSMADMETLLSLCKEYRLKLIEDATEALGTKYTEGSLKGRFAGTIGDFGAYSFNGNKIITTGGGGMITARNEEDLKKAVYLSAQAKDDPFHYIHHEVGYNYRMTNLQAALGVGQLECLEEYIEKKRKNYGYYKSLLKDRDDVSLLSFCEKARNNHWFYSLLLNNHKSGRDELMTRLRESGIETRPIWKLIHTQTMYKDCQAYYIEKAPFYQSNVINLPCSVNLKEADMNFIVKTLNEG